MEVGNVAPDIYVSLGLWFVRMSTASMPLKIRKELRQFLCHLYSLPQDTTDLWLLGSHKQFILVPQLLVCVVNSSQRELPHMEWHLPGVGWATASVLVIYQQDCPVKPRRREGLTYRSLLKKTVSLWYLPFSWVTRRRADHMFNKHVRTVWNVRRVWGDWVCLSPILVSENIFNTMWNL